MSEPVTVLNPLIVLEWYNTASLNITASFSTATISSEEYSIDFNLSKE
jgi:hypothetical protein